MNPWIWEVENVFEELIKRYPELKNYEKNLEDKKTNKINELFNFNYDIKTDDKKCIYNSLNQNSKSNIIHNRYSKYLQNNKFIIKKCPNKKCLKESYGKEETTKCRYCNHCFHCKKNLKSGGGRHRLCECKEKCFDQRDGRKMCQKCFSTRLKKKS